MLKIGQRISRDIAVAHRPKGTAYTEARRVITSFRVWTIQAAIVVLGCALWLTACGGGGKSGTDGARNATDDGAPKPSAAADAGKVLNLFIWSDDVAPSKLPNLKNMRDFGSRR